MLGLYFRTARHYRPSQIAARLRLRLDSFLMSHSQWLAHQRYSIHNLPKRNENAKFFYSESAEYRNEIARWRAIADSCEEGRFRFLNRTIDLGRPINWQAPGATRLWRYNLHYFQYALDLALLARAEADGRTAASLAHLCQQWIESNTIGIGIGWHSYPLARRIVHWIQAISMAPARSAFSSPAAQAAWLKSLYQQTRYLEDHLEFDSLGNHLLADAKALVFAGIFFSGKTAARWLDLGEQLLWNGVREQILEDGGHYERSSMYHSIVLQDFLETVLALQLNQREVPQWVREKLIAMADFLAGITHPDGEIPLFGDSAFGVAHRPTDVLAAAEVLLGAPGRWRESEPGEYCALVAPQAFKQARSVKPVSLKRDSWPATGYLVLRREKTGDQMIVDTRSMGPDHIPAHGHCSAFSYELSIGGERLVVDSGVDEYEPGPWRQFWRSTRAHNTVWINDSEQSEIWGSFRVGERSKILGTECVHRESSTLFVGTMKSFESRSSSLHQRRFIAALGEFWVVFDEITGTGRHRIESLVHFHPDALCEIHSGYASVVLRSIDVRLYPYAADRDNPVQMSCVRGQQSPIQGWYAGEFGKREPNFVLSLACNAPLPATIGYLIAPGEHEITSWDFQYRDVKGAVEAAVLIRTRDGDLVENFQSATMHDIVAH
ncbi:MAG TPA: alginate lyase family protein [Candidatus Sulfotelmatobacter sp.]|nr:alginate lyase family protein [Candidatus Sulfotelmatobacter sp.]